MVNATNGTQRPATCNAGDWFYDNTQYANPSLQPSYCLSTNKWVPIEVGTAYQSGVPILSPPPGANHYRLIGLKFTVLAAVPRG